MLIKTLLIDPVLFFRIILIVIASVCLHELAHGWAALSQGDDTPKKTGHMTLNPVIHMGWESIIFLCLAGIAWGQMPVNPSRFRHRKWGNILVSAAGPLSNLTLGILFILLLQSNVMILSPKFLWLAAHVNLTLFIFNLLPIPPLDGFHVCSEFFPGLKQLESNSFGLFAFAVLFTSGFSRGIGVLADAMIFTVIPSLHF
jgi:Zn-dependent protease